jgi:hypothetical protein
MVKYKEPQIYVANNDDIAEFLSTNYNVASGNLGVTKIIQFEQYENNKYVDLDYKMIGNLHEYSIVIIDLQRENDVKYCEESEEPDGIPYLFQISYPQKELIPTPLVLSIMKSKLRTQCLKVIFAGNDYTEKYNVIEVIKQKQYSYSYEEVHNVYEIIQASATSKHGKKMQTEKNNLANCISQYAKEYKVVFGLPTKWDKGSHTWITDPNYIPLMKNQDGEVISYIGYSENCGYEIVLPVCEKKEELIVKLLSSVLPEIIPSFFPESKEFAWINEQEFLPKEILAIEEERNKIQEEYNLKINSLDERRIDIEKKYKFLNDLLIETGDKLVDAVCTYFKWLGFSNVEAIDGNEDILREDIQITEDDKMYIIEVKGIGGTSTDSECSQVAKHRRKREKEHRDKEIIPIYIVNHQRYMRPSLRQNPPFSDNQIDYAENDERGLLTTLQLYNQYKLIESGIFTKDETRNSLVEWGLISLIPKNLISIGIYDEYFKKPKAGILTLNNVRIKVGDEIYAQKGERWIRTQITSIQLNDENVDCADNGEVGIVTDIELEKGFEIFIKSEVVNEF